MGGLSRRAYILNKIRQEESKPILVLDAGAMLFPQPFVAPALFPAKTVQARGLIEAMAKMEYDAFGLASQDLAAGTDFLLHQPTEVQLPWLSMNLVQENGQKLIFAPYIIKTAGQLSVGILALTGHQKNAPNQEPQIDYQIIAWEKALEVTLAQIKNRTDMVILLSSLPEQTNRQIAEKFSDIHLIIQSGQSTANKRPRLFGNALITQIGSRGKYLGRLDINWGASHTWEQSITSGIKPTKDRLDRTNWQIGRLEKRYANGELEELKQNAQYKQLLQDQNRLKAELTELEARSGNIQGQLSTYKSSFIGLPVSLPVDPKIQKIVFQTKLAVNNANQSSLEKTKQGKIQANLEAFSNLAGWQMCQSCHQPQTSFWQQTAHAKAWRTLVMVNQQYNPDCLICHVTLPTYDQDTVTRQNLLAGLEEKYKTIGCETCHGPAKNHALQPELHRPLRPDEQTCLTCHTPERDDNFVYLEKLKKIRCPTSGH
jgi:hypothetical protein